MKNNPLPRIDTNSEIHHRLVPVCRLRPGEIWEDPLRGHRVACLDAANAVAVRTLVGDSLPTLAIQDPPYNVAALETLSLTEYISWCERWVKSTYDMLAEHASLYVWLGADQNDGFQPLADFMLMMRRLPFKARSFITMRNQRGYGTQKNWMAVRQELLYYVKGAPPFNVSGEYTEIPKILRGYYKEVGGKLTENIERSGSDTIRAGNVWVDIQQVFYRMEENVSGCYAQKPLKSAERILSASSQEADIVLDLFAHSGTTLLAAERLHRVCFTADIDPVFCEMAIRRLEHYRRTGRLGWQNGHAFEAELPDRFASSSDDAPPGEAVVQASLF